MEAARGKYAAGNKEFFLKMRAQMKAKTGDDSGGDDGDNKPADEKQQQPQTGPSSSSSGAGFTRSIQPPSVAAKPGKNGPPPVAAKPKSSRSSTSSKDGDADEQRRKEEEAARRQRELEEYEQQKQKLAREEEEERRKKEEKERKKKERLQRMREEEERLRREREEKDRAMGIVKDDGDDKTSDDGDAQAGGEDAAATDEQEEAEGQEVKGGDEAEEGDAEEESKDAKKPEIPPEVHETLYRCEALIAYKAKTKKELSFEKGDIIYVPKSGDTKRRILQGVCKGKQGIFPGHLVVDTHSGERLGDPALHYKMGVKCFIVGNYKATKRGELSVSQGDSVYVPILNNNPMIQVVCKGKVGLVPRKFVVDEEERERMQQEQADVAKQIVRLQAIKPYKGRPGWLTFTYFDVVLVPKPCEGDVWEGVCKGNVGKFYRGHLVDTATHTKEEIEKLVQEHKAQQQQQQGERASSSGGGDGDAFDPFTAADSTATGSSAGGGDGDAFDPFAPNTTAPQTATGGFDDDPFAPKDSAPVGTQQQQQAEEDDPFMPKGEAFDPFAPAPTQSQPQLQQPQLSTASSARGSSHTLPLPTADAFAPHVQHQPQQQQQSGGGDERVSGGPSPARRQRPSTDRGHVQLNVVDAGLYEDLPPM